MPEREVAPLTQEQVEDMIKRYPKNGNAKQRQIWRLCVQMLDLMRENEILADELEEAYSE